MAFPFYISNIAYLAVGRKENLMMDGIFGKTVKKKSLTLRRAYSTMQQSAILGAGHLAWSAD